MKANVSILTINAQDATAQGISDYQNAVAAHVGGDWAAHNQLAFYGTLAYAEPVTGNTIAGAGLMRILLSGTNTDGTGDGRFAFPVIDTGVRVATAGAVPFILAQPAALTVSAGTSALFTVSVASAGVTTYQWARNGTVVGGATSPDLVIAAATVADAGVYTVTVTNVYGSTSSIGVTLTID